MHVDPAAEDLVREAVRMAIAQDNDGSLAALDAISAANLALMDRVMPIESWPLAGPWISITIA
ncbi:hypothetical protein GCM10022223_45680 [Kineosporia mesophila]|uniref:Uncharacterized protein n=1 Tax=Kineosporia mesophila TaxID=566012 RepID=A0ABP7A2E1_9ACTN